MIKFTINRNVYTNINTNVMDSYTKWNNELRIKFINKYIYIYKYTRLQKFANKCE